MKIRTFLSVVIVSAAVLPLLSVSSLLFDVQERSLAQSMSQELKRVVHGMVLDLDYKFSRLSTQLDIVSHDEDLIRSISLPLSERQNLTLLTTLMEQNTLVKALYLLDPNLDVVESLNGVYSLESSLLLQDLKMTINPKDKRPLRQQLFYWQGAGLVDETILWTPDAQQTHFVVVLFSPVYQAPIQPSEQPVVVGYIAAIIPEFAIYDALNAGLTEGESIEFKVNPAANFLTSFDVSDQPNSSLMIKHAGISTEHTSNRLNYSLVLHGNSDFRLKQQQEIYKTISTSFAIVLIGSLLAALGIVRWILSRFDRMTLGLSRFKEGHYDIADNQVAFYEFEEVHQLLSRMANTIQEQLSDLVDKNEELKSVDQAREHYLQEVKLLNEELEMRVDEQTQAIRHALDKEESLKRLLQGLLDLTVRLQRYDNLSLVVQDSLEHLSSLLGRSAVGIYLSNQKKQDGYFNSYAMSPMIAQYLKSSLNNFDGRHAKTLPKQIDIQGKMHDIFGLVSLNDLFLGAIVIQSPNLDTESRAVLALFAKQVSAVIETIQLTSELEASARTDELTRFANRKAFNEALEHAASSYERYRDRHIGLLVIDANGLKRVNDRYGHDVGDNLICLLSTTLSAICRQTDLVFRLGGDEFAILVEKGTQQSCDALVQRLEKERLRHTLTVLRNNGLKMSIPVTFSVGCASTEECSVADLFRLADQRMYEQKQAFYKENTRVV